MDSSKARRRGNERPAPGSPLSITDAITKPWESPYAGYGNNPVSFIDPLGLSPEEGEKDGKGRLPHEVKDLDPVVVTAERPAETNAPSNNQSSGPEKFVDIAGMTYQPLTSYDGRHITDYAGIFIGNTIKSFSNNFYGAIDGAVNLPHTLYTTIDAAGKVGAAANAAVHYTLSNPERAAKTLATASAAVLTNPHFWENTVALGATVAITTPRPSKAVATRVMIAEEAAPNLVKIINIEDDIIEFSSKIGDETVQGMAGLRVEGNALYLDNLHLHGAMPGKVGRKALWDMAKDLGKQYNVQDVFIQGGSRTTGALKGTKPSVIHIKVN